MPIPTGVFLDDSLAIDVFAPWFAGGIKAAKYFDETVKITYGRNRLCAQPDGFLGIGLVLGESAV